jgi:hypothetical protein
MEAQWAIGMLDVHPVEEQHVEVDIEAIPGILPFTPSGPAFGCSKSLPAIFVCALPSRWIRVTAPVWAVFREKPSL